MVNQKYTVTCDICGKEEEYWVDPIGLSYKKLKMIIEMNTWSYEEKQTEEIEVDICNDCIKKYFGELREKALTKAKDDYVNNKSNYRGILKLEIE